MAKTKAITLAKGSKTIRNQFGLPANKKDVKLGVGKVIFYNINSTSDVLTTTKPAEIINPIHHLWQITLITTEGLCSVCRTKFSGR
jgi:hypothetical protein